MVYLIKYRYIITYSKLIRLLPRSSLYSLGHFHPIIDTIDSVRLVHLTRRSVFRLQVAPKMNSTFLS